jgi:hypothetical protein
MGLTACSWLKVSDCARYSLLVSVYMYNYALWALQPTPKDMQLKRVRPPEIQSDYLSVATVDL